MEIVIIEDEVYNQRMLSGLIEKLRPEWKIAEILTSVEDSILYLKKNKPNLVFMDVQLQDGICFSIFENVTVASPVIFTTAYDNYAIQAFKVNSIDYLLKPIKESELENAIQKFENINYRPAPANQTDFKEIIEAIRNGTPNYRRRLLTKGTKAYFKLDVKDVAFFYSENKVTSAVTYEKKEYVLDSTLETLEEELDPKEFYRANRSTILHIDSIFKIENYFGGKLHVKLLPKLNTEVIVSRLRNIDFRNWIGEI